MQKLPTIDYIYINSSRFLSLSYSVIKISFTETSNRNVPNTNFYWKASAVPCNKLYEEWYIKKNRLCDGIYVKSTGY